MSVNQPVKLTMLMLLSLLLLSYGVGSIQCATVLANNTDMSALLDFRAIANDPTGALGSWNSSIHYCKWRGVTCGSKHPEQVTALNLTGYGLSGPIAASVGNISFLHTLDLSNNQFSGQIPSLSNLQKMQFLNLSFNSLEGHIPDSLTNCSNLRLIDVSSNSLEGEIPLRFDLLSNLLDLTLSYNKLTGVIPPTLSNITGVQKLCLAHNNLQGSIPEELGNLPNLSVLLLGGNKLSGEIPQSLFNLSSLQRLGLELNVLGGSLPSNIGDAYPNIQQILLGGNKFEGHIPTSLGNASRLNQIDFSNNTFTGQVPSSFGKLKNLRSLNLEINSLEANDSQSWDFLYAMTNCSSLHVLSLSLNQLRGYIPNSIGNLSSVLVQITMGGNMISGVVPPSIGNLQSLIQLSLDENNLSGTIEEWVGKLTQLQILNLQLNNFTGPIPSSVGNLTQVTKVLLGSNQFEGPIPSTLGNLERPTILDLSQNNLQGNIPPEITYLEELFYLDLSSNKLSGEIPDGWGKFQTIQTLKMAQNVLTGNIPQSFGKLETLSTLNLSYNSLSGVIPTALTALQSSTIDLSYNRLQGGIPTNGIFENTTAVSLNGNWGLCGGVMDLRMPPCTQRQEKRLFLVRLLIPIFAFMSIIMLIYIITLREKTPKGTYLFLLSFGKKFPKVSYNDLAQATGNFSKSNLIGRGSYGSVYRGKLTQDRIEVAIKVFDLDMRCGDKSFVSECEVLRSIRHRNLLPILTACSTIDSTGHDFKALVYEFMQNGNMDTWLHQRGDSATEKCLSLAQRISIAVDIANALAYLHHDCGWPIIHCDLKPSNILLDHDMNAYLGDFGIASLLDSRSASVEYSNSISAKGTIGYIAPEYAHSVHASACGDIYSFGIVLLEMLIGKRPTDSMFENELNIVNFAERNFPDQILHIIDACIQQEWKSSIHDGMETETMAHQCVVSLVQVAIFCTRLIPRDRINMRDVALRLHRIQASYGGQTK